VILSIYPFKHRKKEFTVQRIDVIIASDIFSGQPRK